MRILLPYAYYEPEQVSSAHLTSDLEEQFSEEGFFVEIVVPTPTRGVSTDCYKKYKKIRLEEKFNGLFRIHRFRMFREGRNPILRAVRYLFCNISQYWHSSRLEGVDIILAMSTPPTQGVLCANIKKHLQKKYKKPVTFIYVLQDVFPDSLLTTGLASQNAPVFKIGKRIERYTYEHADQIIVISEDIKKNLLSKGVPSEKLHVIYNWIDTTKVHPVEDEKNSLLNELDIDRRKFRVVYAGNMGMAQGLETVISAARLLKNREDILFVLFGSGAEEASLKEKAVDLPNVRFFPLLPVERSAEVYSLGNACIVSCRKGTGGVGVPSKTWSIMACARPVLLSFDRDSELSSVITRSQSGLHAESGNAESLAANVEALVVDRDGCVRMGQNARQYVENNVDREQAVRNYIEILRRAGE